MPVVLAGMVLLGSSCTGLKYASEEKPLFKGYAVVWEGDPVHEAKDAQRELEAVVTPAPNNSLLGMRPTVALHNAVKETERTKGLGHLLKHKIGSAPVYLVEVPLDDINAALVNRMVNRGYFAASCRYTVERGERTATVRFIVRPGEPHVVRSILWGEGNSPGLDSALAGVERGTALVTGEPYHLAKLTSERDRATDRLRNQGWYRVRPDDLVWAADTTLPGRGVALHLRVKPATSLAKRTRYTIGSVTVHGDRDELLPATDTVLVESLHYVNYFGMYRPHTITRGVFIRPGDHYSLRRHNTTQRYLGSYGVFNNVTINYHEDSVRSDVLHAEVLLTPQQRFSLFSELNAVSKSNNFAGPGLKFGFRDRGLFRGAEQFTIDLNTRFETQLAGAGRGTSANEIGGKAALQVPRMLLLPFLRTARTTVPFTHFELGYGLFRRIGLFGLESANLGMGYTWREDRRTWHDLQLLDVSFNNLNYSSPEFDAFLSANPVVQRSFEEQFIIGFGYTYTRTTQRNERQRGWLVYTLGGDEGGLLTSAVFRGVEGPRPEEGYLLFGERYAQFLRLRPELRWYKRVGARDALLVSRLLVFGAYAYGNGTTVPYVKQFFVGGTNSLRGFRARSVGPGSYAGATINNLLIDQVGDVRIEANMEYRFTLSGFVKAAFFADAGNVWLWKDDPQRPGGTLELDDFLGELAMDAGFGLRIDPEVIVIRLDLAAPLHRPDRPVDQRWVFRDPAARWSRGLIFNIAIGYPF